MYVFGINNLQGPSVHRDVPLHWELPCHLTHCWRVWATAHNLVLQCKFFLLLCQSLLGRMEKPSIEFCILKYQRIKIQPQRPLPDVGVVWGWYSGPGTLTYTGLKTRIKEPAKAMKPLAWFPPALCTESPWLPRAQWLVLECLWSLSGNSASICHITKAWSFIGTIRTFQMH